MINQSTLRCSPTKMKISVTSMMISNSIKRCRYALSKSLSKVREGPSSLKRV